jgi:hypothetical protein
MLITKSPILSKMGPCRHVIAFSETGAVHSSINYYHAAYQGLWAAKSGSKPVGIQLPVGIIWGEDDHYLGKELAEPPKSLASNVSITFLPGVSSNILPILSLGTYQAFSSRLVLPYPLAH